MFSHIKPVVFYEAEGTNASGTTPPVETPPSNTPTKADVENMVKRTIEDVLGSKRVNGDTSAALEVLAAKALKEEKRAQEAESKAGIIPADAKAKLDAYELLGAVEDLTKRLETATTLETEKTQRDLTDTFRKAAAVAGYDADALLEVIGTVPETIIETVKQGDKEIQTSKVKVLLDGTEDITPFEDVIKGRFTKIHDSLKIDAKKVTLPNMGVNNGQLSTETEARKEHQKLYSGSNF